jgi:hypothetical protein
MWCVAIAPMTVGSAHAWIAATWASSAPGSAFAVGDVLGYL